MRLTTFRILVCVTLLVLVLSACTSAAPATPIPPTPSVPAPGASDTPGNTPTLLAFPTVTPVAAIAPPTAPAATSTIAASPTTPSGVSVSRPLSGGPPVVQMAAPITNTQVSLNQTVYVVALASSDSNISRVELFDDSTSVKVETPPTPVTTFTAVIPWTPNTIGAHNLRLVAYDANNIASPPDDANITVTPDSRKPTATIIYPIGIPQVEQGSLLQIYAVGTDESSVTQLDLVVDDQLYTYVTAQNNSGQFSLSYLFAWNASTAGNHTIVVRAHDDQDQTTDSAPLKVFIADTHNPSVAVNYDRTNALAGEPVTITVSAVDASGIQRLELWTGREISNTVTSTQPARQTSLSAQFIWQQGTPGDYPIKVRAYNANGNFKDSATQVVSILKPGQVTPTRPPTLTPTRTRTPRPSPTPRLQPPSPPSAELSQPADHFTGTAPVKISFNGRGNAELLRVEVWGYYPGQVNPQIICTLDAHATTQRSGDCNWIPNTAGLYYIYVQAIDIYGQIGRSQLVSGTVNPPSLPTPTPTPVSMAGRWTGTGTAGQYSVVFRPIVTASGTALRGDFKITTTITPTVETNGRITSGTAKGDRVTFHVDFTPATATVPTTLPDTPVPTAAPTATPSAPALDFDCGVDATSNTLDCKIKDSRNQSSAVVLKREASP